MKTIGLIGGMSWESTVPYYQIINRVVGRRLGGLHSAHRNFVRGERGFWNSRDPEFILAEDRIGVELAEFVDRLDFPGRVAEMLPRLPGSASTAAREIAAATVEEIRHG